MAIFKETVVGGAPHPGTPLRVMSSNAGYYLGYAEIDGRPYTRETKYMTEEQACELLAKFRETVHT